MALRERRLTLGSSYAGARLPWPDQRVARLLGQRRVKETEPAGLDGHQVPSQSHKGCADDDQRPEDGHLQLS
jgi:hypothetical protein